MALFLQHLQNFWSYLVEGMVSTLASVASSVLDSAIFWISSALGTSDDAGGFDGDNTFVLSFKSLEASGELGGSHPDDFVNVFRSLNFRMFRFKNNCLLGRCIDYVNIKK